MSRLPWLVALTALSSFFLQPVGVASSASQVNGGCTQSATTPTPPGLFAEFLKPFRTDADQQRQRLAAWDPSFTSRVDRQLNAGRVNFGVFGMGESATNTFKDREVSIMIVSVDVERNQMYSVSLSRDIRVPELEDRTKGIGRDSRDMRKVYAALGFDGARSVIEESTGISVDYVIIIKDIVLYNYINEISGPVTIEVLKEHQTTPFLLGGKRHDGAYFAPGVQTMDADTAMTYVLSEDESPDLKEDERSYRKNAVVSALVANVQDALCRRDVGFVIHLSALLARSLAVGDLQLNFDQTLLLNGLNEVAHRLLTNRDDVELRIPRLLADHQLVVHDLAFGDGGVRRVHAISDDIAIDGHLDHPFVQEEVRGGYLPLWMLIPMGGNPYAADLVHDYWFSVRSLVATTLDR
jgi:hypothetical protein